MPARGERGEKRGWERGEEERKPLHSRGVGDEGRGEDEWEMEHCVYLPPPLPLNDLF